MDRFARRTAFIALGQAAVKVTQLILAIVLVRMLTPSQWGETALLLSIYLAATAIGTLNLHHSLVFFLPRALTSQRRGLVLANVGVLLAVGATIALGLTVIAPMVADHTAVQAADVRWIGLAVMLEMPSALWSMMFIASERLGLAAVWDVAGTVVIITATVVGAVVGDGASGVAIGLIAAGGLRFVAGLVALGLLLPGGGHVPVATVKRQLLYSLPLGLALTVSMLNRLVDKWLIAVFDSDVFGIYAIAAQEIPLLSVLPYAGGTALVVALVEAFHHDDVATARSHWLHLTRRMSAIVVPLGFGLILIAPELMTWIFTDEFAVGVLPFQLFTLITIHRVAEYGVLLRAAGRTRALLVVAGVTLGANTVLAGIGAAAGGMVGASIGTVIASAIGWFVVLRHIAASLEVPVRRAFAWRTWIACVVAAAVAALVAQVSTDLWASGTWTRILGKLLVFGIVFIAALQWWRSRPASAPPTAQVGFESARAAPPRIDAAA